MVDKFREDQRVTVKVGDFYGARGWVDQSEYEEDEGMVLVEFADNEKFDNIGVGEKQPFKPSSLSKGW